MTGAREPGVSGDASFAAAMLQRMNDLAHYQRHRGSVTSVVSGNLPGCGVRITVILATGEDADAAEEMGKRFLLRMEQGRVRVDDPGRLPPQAN